MNRKLIIFIVSLVLYISSLFLPAYNCGLNYAESMKGYEVLYKAWFAIIVLEPRWYTNLIYFYVVSQYLFKKNYKPNIFLTLCLIIGACSTLFYPSYLACKAMSSSLGYKGLATGGYLWCASVLTMALSRFASGRVETQR